jgi:hypothetical protein
MSAPSVCCPECFHEFDPRRNPVKNEKRCVHCNDIFETDDGKRKFCSRWCQVEEYNRRRRVSEADG